MDIAVLAIWIPMLTTDLRTGRPQVEGLIDDPRAVHLWDRDRQVGRWFKENVLPSFSEGDEPIPGSRVPGLGRNEVVWDTYLLYDREARWDDAPGPLRAWGFPVVRQGNRLISEVKGLQVRD